MKNLRHLYKYQNHAKNGAVDQMLPHFITVPFDALLIEKSIVT